MKDLIESINRYFSDMHIPNAILRNYQDLPDHVENDIDWFVDKKISQQFIQAIIPESWRVLTVLEKDGLSQYHFYSKSKNRWLQIDFFHQVNYKGYSVISKSELLSNSSTYKDFTVVSPLIDAYISLVTKLLHNSKVKEDDKAKILTTLSEHPKQFEELLKKYFTSTISTLIVDAISKKDWDKVGSFSGLLRRIHLKKKLPVKEFIRLIKRFSNPSFPSIAISGTIPTEKAAIIEKIREVFPKIKTFQSKSIASKNETVFSEINSGKKTAKFIHNKQIVSVVQSLYNYLTYTFTFWLTAYPHMAKGNLVIFNHSYYYYYANKKSSHTKLSDWLFYLWEAILPKPQLVFHLSSNSDSFLSINKQLKEIFKDQTEITQDTCIAKNNIITVNAEQTPNEIASEIVSIICEINLC